MTTRRKPTKRELEQRVIRAAKSLVGKKGFGYFGIYQGRGLCDVKKMERLENACAALAAHERRKP